LDRVNGSKLFMVVANNGFDKQEPKTAGTLLLSLMAGPLLLLLILPLTHCRLANRLPAAPYGNTACSGYSEGGGA
jgi:hypothetical protein